MDLEGFMRTLPWTSGAFRYDEKKNAVQDIVEARDLVSLIISYHREKHPDHAKGNALERQSFPFFFNSFICYKL